MTSTPAATASEDTVPPVERGGGTVARLAWGAALAALIVPRLHSGSALWLDEALSVDIARLPVPDLFTALRHDGAPPLYYLLLHAWIAVFGTGDTAVRSLSTLCSLLALPSAYAVGRRLGGLRCGDRVGAWAVLLLAASPFAIRYATETRMYALVMLLALWWVLATLRALERPTSGRLAAAAVVAGLLLLTHYWAFFMLGAGEALLVAMAARQRWGGPAARIALTMPLGGLLFVPWLPTFLFQAGHTGTPWRPAPTGRDAYLTWFQWQGPGWLAAALGVLMIVLVGAALRGRVGRRLLVVGLGGLLFGLGVSRLQGAAYALRYSAPLLVLVLLTAAVGAASLRLRARCAAGVFVTGLALSVAALTSMLGPRTQAAATAHVLRADLGAQDVVVYCPDQLGPAVARLLPPRTRQVVYPTMAPPQLVDWVDYAARNAAGSPSTFARQVVESTTGTIWLLRADGYLTYGDQCAELDHQLALLRGTGTVRERPSDLRDGGQLVEFPPPPS